MKYSGVLLVAMFVLFGSVAQKSFSQNVAANTDEQLSYTKVINERAAKIVATLGITDSLKANRVKKIIADQYRSLNDIHTYRNDKTKALKSSGTAKEAVDAQVKSLEDEANVKLTVL